MIKKLLYTMLLWQASTLVYANGFSVSDTKETKSHFSEYIGFCSKGCTGFDGVRNEHGSILTSSGLRYEWIGMGAYSTIRQIQDRKRFKKVVLYLGRSCDAYSKVYGEGTWSWANGGFVVEFKNERFSFSRQELDIASDEAFGCSME